MNKKQCKGCKYYRPIGAVNRKRLSGCNYLLDTGHTRGKVVDNKIVYPKICDKKSNEKYIYKAKPISVRG